MTTDSYAGEGKVWLITGASSGFGRKLAEAVAAAGATVVAAARRPEGLADLTAQHPGRVLALALDVTDGERIGPAVGEALERAGRIDVLVNNAGRGHVGAVEETTERELRDLMDLHFFGPAALVRAVLPHMRERGSGAVVQVTSMGGQLSFPGVGAYSATKFALEGLTEALAGEVAPHGIRTLIVEPGAFRTGFTGGGALRQSAPLPAYQATVGPVREALPKSNGKEPGDPAKAAAAIIAALDAEKPPLRLVLGNDAVAAVLAHADAVRADVLAWERLGRGTDFD